jgi:hypothetical protein
MILNIGYTLGSLLSRLSRDDLAQYAQWVKSSETAMETIFETATDPDRLHQVLTGLSEPAQNLLVTIYLRGGTIAQEQASQVDHVGDHLQELATAGLILVLRNHYYGIAYAVPMDFGPRIFHDLLMPRVPRAVTHSDRAPRREKAYLDWFPFFHDLFQVLSMARRDAIALPQQGHIYKRVEKQILPRLWPGIQSPKPLDRLYLALDFAHVNGLIGPEPAKTDWSSIQQPPTSFGRFRPRTGHAPGSRLLSNKAGPSISVPF